MKHPYKRNKTDKLITGSPYYITREGTIYNLLTGKDLKPLTTKKGYKFVILTYNDHTRKSHTIASLLTKYHNNQYTGVTTYRDSNLQNLSITNLVRSTKKEIAQKAYKMKKPGN